MDVGLWTAVWAMQRDSMHATAWTRGTLELSAAGHRHHAVPLTWEVVTARWRCQQHLAAAQEGMQS